MPRFNYELWKAGQKVEDNLKPKIDKFFDAGDDWGNVVDAKFSQAPIFDPEIVHKGIDIAPKSEYIKKSESVPGIEIFPVLNGVVTKVVSGCKPLQKTNECADYGNYIEIKEGDKKIKYLVEIKPSKQTTPPTVKYKKKRHLIYEQRCYAINQAKWSAAKEYSKKIGGVFIILTEKELIRNK